MWNSCGLEANRRGLNRISHPLMRYAVCELQCREKSITAAIRINPERQGDSRLAQNYPLCA